MSAKRGRQKLSFYETQVPAAKSAAYAGYLKKCGIKIVQTKRLGEQCRLVAKVEKANSARQKLLLSQGWRLSNLSLKNVEPTLTQATSHEPIAVKARATKSDPSSARIAKKGPKKTKTVLWTQAKATYKREHPDTYGFVRMYSPKGPGEARSDLIAVSLHNKKVVRSTKGCYVLMSITNIESGKLFRKGWTRLEPPSTAELRQLHKTGTIPEPKRSSNAVPSGGRVKQFI